MRIAVRILLCAALLAGVLVCAHRFGVEFSAVVVGEPKSSASRMMAWFVGFLGLAVTLGVLAAAQIGRFLGNRAESHILQGEKPHSLPPEVQEAEALVKQGQALDAVRLLRSCLERHPSELEVQFRIADLYEHQLKNPLAAALEYEELLKHRLDSERWGWTALRLARIYQNRKEPEKSEALLRRVITEAGASSAAKKARKVLGLREDEEPAPVASAQAAPGKPVREEERASPAARNLPPGFRPK